MNLTRWCKYCTIIHLRLGFHWQYETLLEHIRTNTKGAVAFHELDRTNNYEHQNYKRNFGKGTVYFCPFDPGGSR